MENKKQSVLIVGQGLAGSLLAYHFLEAGYHVRIFDAPQVYFKSSHAAGGLFNPVTGRKLEKTWLADELFPYLFQFYPQLEKKIGSRFFYPMPLFRPYVNQEMKSWLLERKKQIDHTYLDWTSDGVFIRNAGWVDVDQLLKAFESYFSHLHLLTKEEFVYENLQFDNRQSIIYQQQSFDFVLFCEGFHAQKNNPYFNQLCFLPAKGEVLKINTEEANEGLIINKNGFLLPIGDQQFKVGATYSWDDLSNQPRDIALSELKSKVAQFGINRYRVNELLVGVRPATQDRRPFVGLKPGSNIGIFNGFGSKGVSLIPYFANQFVGHLQKGQQLNDEVSIHRFSHLFSI